MPRVDWAPARRPWRLRLRRALARSRTGHALKRTRALVVRRRRRVPPPSRVAAPARVQNVVLVSHCDFTGNSAFHAYAIATELARRGLSPAIAVPAHPETVEDLPPPPFPVVTYRDLRRGRPAFPDGRGIDLVHAFSPREHVRRVTAELGLPYVVHLEDNDETIAGSGSDAAFLAGALGATVVIERLLELVPVGIPTAVVWPGFDEAVLTPRRSREAVRADLGLAPEDLVLVYTGNVHETNLEEVRALYEAVGLLRARGQAVVLVKTGWNFVPDRQLPTLREGLRDLGWVARAHIPDLLAAADVLVQPGRPGIFNDYRFPSKVPDFLASGRPVVLPRTNIGLHLEDGADALLLDRGDADEISANVARLATDPAARERIGVRGRKFALRELRWPANVERVVELYAHGRNRHDVAGQIAR
jgi:glycosyltransferase involved in cell wall biosynthesis